MTLSRSTPLLPLLLASGCITTQIPTRALYENEVCAQRLTEGDCTQAAVHCNLGLEFGPQYADLWNNKGLIADRCLKNPKEAKEDFIKAIRFNQEQASAYVNLGVLYLQEGEFNRAEDSFLRALKVNPDIAEPRFNLGLCYTRMEQWEKARMTFLTLLAVEPSKGRNHHALGVVYYHQTALDDAEQELLTAISLEPSADPEWWNDLGKVQMERGRIAESVADFNSCLSLQPDHALCIHNLRNALEQQKLNDAAMRKQVVQPPPRGNTKAFSHEPGGTR